MGSKVQGKWQWSKPKCEALDPDCENCPFPDCIVSQKMLAKQLGYEEKKNLEARNIEILRLRDEMGLKYEDIAARFGMTVQHASIIVNKMRRKGAKMT